jgi:hypothetical protein
MKPSVAPPGQFGEDQYPWYLAKKLVNLGRAQAAVGKCAEADAVRERDCTSLASAKTLPFRVGIAGLKRSVGSRAGARSTDVASSETEMAVAKSKAP